MMEDTESLKQKLLEGLSELPKSRLREILDFVDFLKFQERKRGNEDPILCVAGCLSGPPLSDEEIEEELYGAEPA